MWTPIARGSMQSARQVARPGVTQDASGTPVYTLDARRGASDLVPATLRSAWWLLAWLLLIVHSVLAVVMFVRARLRAARINAYVAECAEAATRDRNFSWIQAGVYAVLH